VISPVLIFANKTDLEESSVKRIEDAFPQHTTVPLSAKEGENMDEVYGKIAEYFRVISMPKATNADDSEPTDGVQIDLMSGERMDGMATMEKIRRSWTASTTATSSSSRRG